MQNRSKAKLHQKRQRTQTIASRKNKTLEIRCAVTKKKQCVLQIKANMKKLIMTKETIALVSLPEIYL